MIKRIKVRLYPNISQQEMLQKHFGCARKVYNVLLDLKIKTWENEKKSLSSYDLMKELTQIKKKEEFSYLNEVKNDGLQVAAKNVDVAFKNFFRNLKNGTIEQKKKSYISERKRKNLPVSQKKIFNIDRPKFKSKHFSKPSYVQYQNFRILENTNKIIFFKHKLKFRCSTEYQLELRNSKIKEITYSFENYNYYASILIECDNVEKLKQNDKAIGIDLGLKEFLITSDNEIVKNPKFLRKSLKKLNKKQKHLSKKYRINGKQRTKNYEKQKRKVSKLHLKVKNQRKNFLDNLSTRLIKENQIICLETLKVKNMVKNSKLSLSISDASWSMFVAMLEYKANWYGRQIVKIDTFYPSSKTCSNCGNKKESLSLSERIHKCDSCGVKLDRDLNAAINIKNIGQLSLREYIPKVKPVGEKTLVFLLNQE